MFNIFKIDQKKLKYYQKPLLVIISLILGIAIGVNVGDKKDLNKAEMHETGYKYISPLIECFSNQSESPSNNELQSKIDNLIDKYLMEKKISEASVYFRDLANGPWIGINESKKFTPASLLKVPILITYYKIAETKPDILQTKILADSNYEGITIPNIMPTKKIISGQTYTVDELLTYMITDSDNHAANILLNEIPKDFFIKTYSDLGLAFPDISQPDNYMTVKDYASFFRVLYNASYLNKNYSEKALNLLSKSEYKNGLVAGVPSHTEVAHKFGERRDEAKNINQLHDCGIIYKQDKNYLLCIMTRGQNFDNLATTIKDISELVYQNVN